MPVFYESTRWAPPYVPALKNIVKTLYETPTEYSVDARGLADTYRGALQAAQHQQEDARVHDLSLPAAHGCDHPANQVWAMDITYFPMARGFIYLAAVIDWHSCRVLARRVSISMDTEFCTDAVEEAITRYGTPEIFNLDQGSQGGFNRSSHHWPAARSRHPSLDGRQGLRVRQRVHRAAVALDQVQGGVPSCQREREPGRTPDVVYFQTLPHGIRPR